MDKKRFILAGLAVFVAAEILNSLIYGVLLRSALEATANVWRPDMNSKMWIMHLVAFIVAFPFTLIFVRGYEGGGVREGLRYGLLIGVYTAIPMAYGTYGMVAIPHSLALNWMIAGLVESVLLGAVAAVVYKPAGASRTRTAAA